MTHLWEVEHDYYCNEGNYYAPGNDQPSAKYKRWQDYAETEADADLDMNLLFRWDWEGGDGEADDNYRGGRLLLFFMGQRKGLYRWAEIEVCRADEAAVRAYLEPRFRHLLSMWLPLDPAQNTPSGSAHDASALGDEAGEKP